ncbi:hypothetical protein BGX28_004853 [Mortierella sp. GBA30]|nr:hypothetical protein BGX28_004853 [Mortierella sp. GBA30]
MSTPKQGKGNTGAAATHSGGMRAEAKKTKVVFKNVLDTPFNIPWPEVTSENNAIVLDVLCDLLKPIREYRRSGSRKIAAEKVTRTATDPSNADPKLPSSESPSSAKTPKPKRSLAAVNHDPQQSPTSTGPNESSKTKRIQAEPPAILGVTTIGINAVTKCLERSIQDLRTYPPPRAIFLCKGDLLPAHLYNHLGPMIAMLPNTTLLFPLMRGSEKKLSEALGMHAVGALAIHYENKGLSAAEGSICKEAEDLIMILGRMVEPMTVSWLPKAIPPPLPKVDLPKKGASEKPSAFIPTSASAREGASIRNSLATRTAVASSFNSTETSTVGVTAAGATSTSISTSATCSAATTSQEGAAEKWIPTNIKTVKTTMPIIVKTPKPAVVADHASDGGNGKKKGQQKQQQKQQHQKPAQMDQSNKKHRTNDDSPNEDRQQGKRSKNS